MLDEYGLPPKINSEQLYRRDLKQWQIEDLRYQDERKAELVAQARQGSQEARETIIHSLLTLILVYAVRLQDGRTDPMELVACGNAVLVEKFEDALQRRSPFAYLSKFAYQTMLYSKQYHMHAITLPSGPGYEPYDILPVFSRFDSDKFDIAETVSQEQEIDIQPVIAAWEALPTEQAKQFMQRSLGISGALPETLGELSAGDSTTKGYQAAKAMRLYHLKGMRRFLEKHHNHFVRHHTRGARNTSRHETIVLPEITMMKLERAAQQLRERGETLSMNKLRMASGVHTRYATAYLHQLRRLEERTV